VATIAALFSNLIQVGLLFTAKPLLPKFSKIIPKFGKYLEKTFSVEGLFNFFKSIAKMLLIGAVAFSLISSNIDRLANLQTASLWMGITTVSGIAIRMIIITSILLLLLSIPDYMFQRWQHRQSLKMSMQEVKQERKDLDGDPLVKSRLRKRMHEIMTRDMLKTVPKADVVITNPTHFAVALEYHKENMAAPQVTARGEDREALMIRRIAEQNDVPIIENKPLARALYKETRVGDFVPVAYWQVVAQILSKVMSINEERR
jgi:flagellar biosynthetic protein FlhB